MHWRRKWQPTPVILPRESQGRQSLVGCRLWGHTESNTTEATLAAAAADTLSEIYVNFQLIHLTGLILCLPMQLILYFCIPDVRYNDIIW